MSEETNQEDLSVEDILSSIKNILVDEDGAPIETAEQEETNPLKMPVEEENEPTDIFDLNDSMIVQETLTEDETNIETLIGETTENTTIAENNPEIITDTDVQDTLNISENIDINNILQNIVPVEEPQKISIEEETPAIEQKASAIEEHTPEMTEVKEETIDASASIINNFAKVFAEKQQEHAQQQEIKSEETPIEKNIQSSIEQTGITDMVQQAIVEQVKTSINSHFEQIASNIIAEQTKIWLNANLPAIVEKTVAKEIERVIAKVGS